MESTGYVSNKGVEKIVERETDYNKVATKFDERIFIADDLLNQLLDRLTPVVLTPVPQIANGSTEPKEPVKATSALVGYLDGKVGQMDFIITKLREIHSRLEI